jgi:hypothetical protein
MKSRAEEILEEFAAEYGVEVEK